MKSKVGLVAASVALGMAGVLSLVLGGAEVASEQAGGMALAQAALAEYEEGVADGSYQAEGAKGYGAGANKYTEWYGMTDAWCAMFVSYCADRAGFVESGLVSKTAWHCGFADEVEAHPEKGTLNKNDGSYVPRPGDIIVMCPGERNVNDDTSAEHTGIVVEVDEQARTFTTVEGNSSDKCMKRTYEFGRTVDWFVSYSFPDASGGSGAPLGPGESIDLPEGLATNVHTYMGWSLVTAKDSPQYRLRADAGETYDSEGFARIGDRYVIACTTKYGQVGDYVDFVQEDGVVIKGIIGDIKNQNDEGCTEWGHDNGRCVVEFVVSTQMWYSGGVGVHANPGTASCHPEWGKKIVKATNYGSWWG